eukprot:gene19888-21830_t
MPRTRPKSLPSADVLSSGSSDSGLDSDVISIYSPSDDMFKSCSADISAKFQFGATDRPLDERMGNLGEALSWIRDELKLMKSQDKHLAKTMIDIRSRIQKTKLELESIRDTGYDSDEQDALENSREREEENQPRRNKTTLPDLSIVNADNFEKSDPVMAANKQTAISDNEFCADMGAAQLTAGHT